MNNIDFSSLGDEIKISLKNKEIDLDTILNLTKKQTKTSVDLYFSKYCVLCTRKDSLGNTIGTARKCAATQRYISGFVDGTSKKSAELGYTVECEED